MTRVTLDAPAIDGKAAAGLIDFFAGTRAADGGTEADYVTLDGGGRPK